MDHNLEDSINMESIDSMDFDHSGVVVNQEDIALEGNQEGMSMDLDTIEEQQALMDSAHEEIIVSDIMGSDQFAFQEYTMQSDNSTGANITVDANLNARNEQQLDLQFADNANKATSSQHNIITIKAVSQRAAKKAPAPAPYPRQVAIAPKPTKGAPNVQYAIAPKPVALVSVNKAKNVQGTLKGNTVLAQIGKQFLMMPAGAAGQKIKVTSLLHPSGSNESIQIVRCNSNDQAQLTANKGTAKQVRTKYIVQGSDSATNASPAVITKLVPVSAAQPRYVMQQKTVPISIGDKMMITTSPKSVKVAPKNQIIAIKPQAQTVVASQANVTTKKVVISANPTQNVILKAGTKTVNAQQIKTTSLIQTQQRTQLHPINVPGKGIQFIKLVTNQATTPKAASKPPPLAVSAKSFVLTDSKGNIIQMSTDKVLSQPPPLIVASTAVTTSNTKLVSKAKKIRIAPISFKAETTTTTAARSSQSLLAPLETPTTVSLEEYNSLVEQNNLQFANIAPAQTEDNNEAMNEDQEQTVDVKPTLASLISDAVAGEESIHENEDTHLQEVEIEYDNTVPQKQERYIEEDDQNSMEQDSSHERIDENIIIVPSNLTDSRQHVDSYQDESNMSMGDTRESENLETDVLQLLSPKATQNYEETPYTFEYETRPEMPDLRPRKACNCTKSQCLKLYCDCFANGEFCNKCNCTNCHNNLDNEELRQKAIRACLERNPNAFRPKIGKGKTGGPEIIRRHNKGCNCKRSGCLKNYCECYEAKIACTLMCKCVGCRNVQETLERRRYAVRMRDKVSSDTTYRPPAPIDTSVKQPCSFMTPEVIEAVSQCMLATVAEGSLGDPVEDILVEFSRCMADIITASHHAL